MLTRTPITAAADVHKIDDGIALLGAMVRAYDNPESHDEDGAIDALREGRPAFWTTAKYHNQAARLVVEWANRSGIAEALRRFSDDSPNGVFARRTLSLLDTLIPLNGAAIMQLAEYRESAALQLMNRAHAHGRMMAEAAS